MKIKYTDHTFSTMFVFSATVTKRPVSGRKTTVGEALELQGLSDARNELIFRCQDFDRLHDIQFPCGLGCSLLRRTIMHQDVNNKEETASAHAQKT